MASALAAVIDLDLTTPSGEPLSPNDSALARQLREEEHNLNEFDGVADADLEDALLDMFKSQGDVREGSEEFSASLVCHASCGVSRDSRAPTRAMGFSPAPPGRLRSHSPRARCSPGPGVSGPLVCGTEVLNAAQKL